MLAREQRRRHHTHCPHRHRTARAARQGPKVSTRPAHAMGGTAHWEHTAGGAAVPAPSGPNMVNVLPEPVWPKTNMHALTPLSQSATTGSALHSYAPVCDEAAASIRSAANSRTPMLGAQIKTCCCCTARTPAVACGDRRVGKKATVAVWVSGGGGSHTCISLSMGALAERSANGSRTRQTRARCRPKLSWAGRTHAPCQSPAGLFCPELCPRSRPPARRQSHRLARRRASRFLFAKRLMRTWPAFRARFVAESECERGARPRRHRRGGQKSGGTKQQPQQRPWYVAATAVGAGSRSSSGGCGVMEVAEVAAVGVCVHVCVCVCVCVCLVDCFVAVAAAAVVVVVVAGGKRAKGSNDARGPASTSTASRPHLFPVVDGRTAVLGPQQAAGF